MSASTAPAPTRQEKTVAPKSSTRSADDTLATAQRHRDELAAELAAIPAGQAAAKDAGDAQTFLELSWRREELEELIRAADTDLLAAQVEAAWDQAEHLHAAELALEAARDQTRMAAGEVRGNSPHHSVTAVERADYIARLARVSDEATTANIAYLDAIAATNVAIADAEELEERLVTAGRRRPTGDGLRKMPPALKKNVVVQRPTLANNGAPVWDRAATAGDEPVALLAGTVPPRWAAIRLTNPALWTDDESLPAAPPEPAGPVDMINRDPNVTKVTPADDEHRLELSTARRTNATGRSRHEPGWSPT